MHVQAEQQAVHSIELSVGSSVIPTPGVRSHPYMSAQYHKLSCRQNLKRPYKEEYKERACCASPIMRGDVKPTLEPAAGTTNGLDRSKP